MQYLNTKLTTVKNGKVFEFTPTENITAYELANVMLYLYACNTVGTAYVKTEDTADFFTKYFKEV